MAATSSRHVLLPRSISRFLSSHRPSSEISSTLAILVLILFEFDLEMEGSLTSPEASDLFFFSFWKYLSQQLYLPEIFGHHCPPWRLAFPLSVTLLYFNTLTFLHLLTHSFRSIARFARSLSIGAAATLIAHCYLPCSQKLKREVNSSHSIPQHQPLLMAARMKTIVSTISH